MDEQPAPDASTGADPLAAAQVATARGDLAAQYRQLRIEAVRGT